MAYDANYLTMVSADGGKNGPRCFAYRTTDAKAVLEAADYISDADNRGMRLGDSVLVQKVDVLAAPTTIESQWYETSAMSATGAATVRVFTAIT